MKNGILIIVVCILALGITADAQIPDKISYQGLLTTSTGTPVQDGSYNLLFEIFTTASGGSSLWSEDHTGVTLQRGTFSAQLGSVTTLSLPFDQPYFVEVTTLAGPGIASPITFAPRTELTSSPYALRADTARYALAAPPGGVAGGDLTGTYPNPTLADDAVTTSKILNNTILREDVATDFKSPLADTADYARTAPGTIDSARVAANAHALQGKDTTALSAKFIDEGQTAGGDLTGTYPNPTIANEAVTSAKILNNTITNADISPSAGIADTKLSGTGSVVLNFNADLLDGMHASSFAASSHSHNYLPLAGGTMTGPIASTGDPAITMGKGNFGSGNINPGIQAFVAGYGNKARGAYSAVGGGGGTGSTDSNSAIGEYSAIAGGRGNLASGVGGMVGGGYGNTASGTNSTVAGGYGNSATTSAAVGGGANNAASGNYSIIPGGGGNTAGGGYSLAAGRRAKTNHDGTFVWGDNTDADFASTSPNQFLIRANSGVGINTTSTPSPLTVNGMIYSITGGYRFPDGTVQSTAVGTGTYLPLTGGTMTGAILNSGNPSISMGKGNFGSGNTNAGTWAFVAGMNSSAGGDYSFAAGRRAKANGSGTFVWADATDADFTASTSNQFLIRANNGVGINTTSTPSPLTVAGMIYSMSGGYRFPDGTVQSTAVGAGTYLPLAGGTMTGAITNSGNPSITMGKGNFGSNNLNPGTDAFVAGINNRARGAYSVVSGGGGAVLQDSNSAIGQYSTVSGGRHNTATASHSTVGGGSNNSASGSGHSTIGGGDANSASNSFATIGGGYSNFASGQYSIVSGGRHNTATASHSTVGGGDGNSASGSSSTVGGGYGNTAATSATVGGGVLNTASGDYSMVLGGLGNAAAGQFSFAAGRKAKANHGGSFVWADSLDADFASSVGNQFNVRATGGTRIFSNSGLTAGVTLAAGASSWSSVSDSTLKRNIRPVNTAEVLEKLAALQISRWSYKAQDPDIEHVGPMAQDFHAAFGLGENNKTISTIDPAGIALAAIQELKKQNDELRATVNELKKEIENMKLRSER